MTQIELKIDGLKACVEYNKDLSCKTWFGVGGKADFYIEPQDVRDLQLIFSQCHNFPITILGAGSNLLIRDGGVEGIVVHLSNGFKKTVVDKNIIKVGAGLSLIKLSQIAAEAELSGFEFMSGIPGSVGGGLKMNAGAYGADLSKICTEVVFMDSSGIIHNVNPQITKFFDYRQSFLPSGSIFIEATFEGKPKDKNQILMTMQELKEKRIASQPQGVKTAGSTFKNPIDKPAWILIDEAGLRGYTYQGAKMSEKHSNFMINEKNATAESLENLGDYVRAQVLEKTGYQLEWEIQIIGKKGK